MGNDITHEGDIKTSNKGIQEVENVRRLRQTHLLQHTQSPPTPNFMESNNRNGKTNTLTNATGAVPKQQYYSKNINVNESSTGILFDNKTSDIGIQEGKSVRMSKQINFSKHMPSPSPTQFVEKNTTNVKSLFVNNEGRSSIATPLANAVSTGANPKQLYSEIRNVNDNLVGNPFQSSITTPLANAVSTGAIPKHPYSESRNVNKNSVGNPFRSSITTPLANAVSTGANPKQLYSESRNVNENSVGSPFRSSITTSLANAVSTGANPNQLYSEGRNVNENSVGNPFRNYKQGKQTTSLNKNNNKGHLGIKEASATRLDVISMGQNKNSGKNQNIASNKNKFNQSHHIRDNNVVFNNTENGVSRNRKNKFNKNNRTHNHNVPLNYMENHNLKEKQVQEDTLEHEQKHYFNSNCRQYSNENKNKRSFNKNMHEKGTKKSFGFKKLEEIYEKDPETIIIELQNGKFENILDTNLSYDYIVLILKVLSKVFKSPFSNCKAAIINMICKGTFLSQLSDYILKLCTQLDKEKSRNTYFWNNPDSFWTSLFLMCDTMLDITPTYACDNLEKILKCYDVSVTSLVQLQNVTISDEINKSFNDLKHKLAARKEELIKRKTAVVKQKQKYQYEEPPNNFRDISVYPETTEIVTNIEPFVRANIIEGPYNDVEHYLDIHFRLLREDFVAPLRSGVCEYLSQINETKKKKISNVKVYPNVYFLSNKTVNDEVGVIVQFVLNKQKFNISLENSKRFIHGSLMCFTRDNFASIIFGRIIERQDELLKKGQLVIGFEEDYKNQYDFNVPYIMVECSVYFEPYYHVLKALQYIQSDYFPMESYIIHVNCEMRPPRYLIHGGGILRMYNNNVYAFRGDTWPQLTHLDDTQFKAFYAALTQEFVVIQGPPGTGKTYLGLEIAGVLLENKNLWNNETNTPMLVICFTNHALDQFLEGLLKFTTKIVRVGGQSKNEALREYNLREWKRRTRNVHDGLGRLLREKGNCLNSILKDIKLTNDCLTSIFNNDGIINIQFFTTIDPQISSSWFYSASTDDIIEWFFGGQTEDDIALEVQNTKFKELRKIVLEKDEATDEERFDELEEQNENNIIDDLIEVEDLISSPHQIYLTNLDSLKNTIQQIEEELQCILKQETDFSSEVKKWNLEENINRLESNYYFLKRKLQEEKPNKLRKPYNIDLKNPNNMRSSDRWSLYFYWLDLYVNYLQNKTRQLQERYKELYKEYAELRDIENLHVLKRMAVVGMTTTCAARLQTTLQALRCPVVIVEEAAEVLESHIIVSLTNYCQHLILIGDHQQLRPTTADYRLETKFNLGISLFERMVLNKIKLNTLGIQHRMRPEIAQLIVPAIYPSLENHESVLTFPSIKGIEKPLYFIHHTKPEQETGDSSKKNDHEAKFIIQLARYLILNGYNPEDITILSAYSGQMFNLRRERKNFDTFLRDVRISVLDNYQGEESNIILLSLVRNNSEDKIGFLKHENRVCVALSRAKQGFYMMGNLNLLCKNSSIWPKVRDVLESQNSWGTSLTLRCQIHRDQITEVEKEKDFQKVPQGGCSQMCNSLLNCGHACKQICHIRDREHLTFRCMESCRKILCDYNHLCPKKCFEVCGQCEFPRMQTLPCGHKHDVPCYMHREDYKCPTVVEAQLPCGHINSKPCHYDIESFKCQFPCDTRLDCGHACINRCHFKYDPEHIEYQCAKPCTRVQRNCSTGDHLCKKMCYEKCSECQIIVRKKRVCGHMFDVACSSDIDAVDCQKPCKKNLPCGHKCQKKCSEPCDSCGVKVEKVSPCGHKVNVACSTMPTRENCKGLCPLLLNCGHPCKNRCNERCTSRCDELVDNSVIGKCGHMFKVPCCLKGKRGEELIQYCEAPCSVNLACGHLCLGTCGKCSQGRIHQSCAEQCDNILVCGHKCETPCRELCPPCTKKCSYKCIHSKCKKQCGQPCSICKEDCPRGCQHNRCTRRCGEKCSIQPCNEPCSKALKCGHECVGFCGEPCPPLCRVCNKEELTEIFFGTEDEEDARFVLLNECKHVIESEGMINWLSGTAEEKEEIGIKHCPKCKTPLSSTLRYSDYIKNAYNDVMEVKKRVVGNPQKNEDSRLLLLDKLENLQIICKTLIECYRVFFIDDLYFIYNFLSKLQKPLLAIRGSKSGYIHVLLIRSTEIKVQIVEQILDTFRSGKLQNQSSVVSCAKCIQFLIGSLEKFQYMSNQTITDYEIELKRLNRIVQLYQIEESTEFRMSKGNTKIKNLFNSIMEPLFAPKRYSDKEDLRVKEELKSFAKEIKSGIAITDAERKEIVKALDLKQGHWFKCPNGHPYVITECGGAMQESKCPDCGEKIGGQHHQLLSSNSLAPEMDGARYAAWSDTANMANYAFR